ncbi:phage tail protein [Azospirillum sp. sgz301742]
MSATIASPITAQRPEWPREEIVSDAYVGEIRIWSFAWAPSGWLLCDGSLLPVKQYQALNALLGKTFGGDGVNTFGLPDLRGRTPIGAGASATLGTYPLGAKAGAEGVTLSPASVPPHMHYATACVTPGTAIPAAGSNMANVVSAITGSTTNFSAYLPAANWTANAQLNVGSITTTGSSAPHNNMQPFTVLNFTICSEGLFPPRN